MPHAIELKNRAIALRKKGFSLKEIADKLQIAKSTASEWLSSIKLSLSAQKRLAKKQILGQYKTVLLKKKLKELNRRHYEKEALETLKDVSLSKEIARLCCTLLWWCEGNKNASFVRFTSSDSTLITNFIFLLRKSFQLDESKFRVLVHIHKYHNDDIQKKYWSNITGIPLTQFHRSYQKFNTGIRIKENYQGCIALTYYNARIAKELEAIYNAFTALFRGVR